ncbi:hypothetical protein OIU79_029031 [Salix purpurea]|uniref:Uncharacterized protein n=1 Tax=Salix purpurea TaxID=77065 RepID=A0A9Q1A3E4_SALPP|nr:hypothetical protein OIU79_029031 [Salix purpurea]
MMQKPGRGYFDGEGRSLGSAGANVIIYRVFWVNFDRWMDMLRMMRNGGNALKSLEMRCAVMDLLYSNRLLEVAKNGCGNYVIQTALKISKSANSPFHEQAPITSPRSSLAS